VALLQTRAPAKVNLSLHVLGRRSDGYHALESLVVFAGAADRLTLDPGEVLSLTVEGATAGDAGPVERNLVVRAARALAARRPGLRLGAFHLVKTLPAAAGIGGGSSDAAAALRLLGEANGLAPADPAIRAAAAETGADIPVCLTPCARMMQGAGEHVGPHLAMPPLFAVLVNPRVAVPTPDVFRGLALAPGDDVAGAAHPVVTPGLTWPALLELLQTTRNDLEPPALALAPVIGRALALLREAPGCRLARMSGSGATVFGLYDDCHHAAAAARAIRGREPDWWVKSTLLR
jgi:4-diphosphocytidyl-2-C-methyl-D-erythritol kinase